VCVAGVTPETHLLLERALCGHDLHGSAPSSSGHTPFIFINFIILAHFLAHVWVLWCVCECLKLHLTSFREGKSQFSSVFVNLGELIENRIENRNILHFQQTHGHQSSLHITSHSPIHTLIHRRW